MVKIIGPRLREISSVAIKANEMSILLPFRGQIHPVKMFLSEEEREDKREKIALPSENGSMDLHSGG